MRNKTTTRYDQGTDDLDDDEYRELLSHSTSLMLACCRVAAVNLQCLANNKRVILRWMGSIANHVVDRAVWIKSNPPPAAAERVLTSGFEDVIILSPDDRPNRAIKTARFHGDVINVFTSATSANASASDDHHAPMTPGLAQWAIESLGAESDFVVDPFGGTGTTAIVAHKLGKRFATVELSPGYCDVIVERWQSETGGKATRTIRGA